MTPPDQSPLPFGLAPEQLPHVEIRFRVSSTKMGSGFDEILLRGNGEVELAAAVLRDDPPQIRQGSVPPLAVLRLLQLLAAEGLEGWDETYPAATRDYVGKVIELSFKEELIKRVAMCQTEFPEFSRAYGAIKLVASLAAPEVVLGGLFNRI